MDPMDPDNPDKNYPINSAITGSIEINPKSGRAKISTGEPGAHLECDINKYVIKILNKEAEGQPDGKARHYGLIIVRPGKEHELSKSEVVDFISFHRHPEKLLDQPTKEQYDLSTYNQVFGELARKQLLASSAL